MTEFFASSVYVKKLEKKTQINDLMHNQMKCLFSLDKKMFISILAYIHDKLFPGEYCTFFS